MTRVDRDGLLLSAGCVCLSIYLGFFSCSAFAGVAVEPNIVYANLSVSSDKSVDAVLKGVINSTNPECWVKGGGVVYMRKRPAGIDDKMIKRAVLQGRLSAKRVLSNALLSYRDGDVDGLDGVVVYTDKPVPRLASMTAKTLNVGSQKIADVKNAKDVELAFCAVKPDVVRAP